MRTGEATRRQDLKCSQTRARKMELGLLVAAWEARHRGGSRLDGWIKREGDGWSGVDNKGNFWIREDPKVGDASDGNGEGQTS